MRYETFIDKMTKSPSCKKDTRIYVHGDYIYKGPERLVKHIGQSALDIAITMDLLGCSNYDIETALFILDRENQEVE